MLFSNVVCHAVLPQKYSQNYTVFVILTPDAAGNFLSPLAGMSYNAYKTVIEIDTIGTFNCSKTVYDKYFKVVPVYMFC